MNNHEYFAKISLHLGLPTNLFRLMTLKCAYGTGTEKGLASFVLALENIHVSDWVPILLSDFKLPVS